MSLRLVAPARPPATLLIRGAHVLDPRTALDEPHDVLVRDGTVAELGAPGTLPEPEDGATIDAAGRHLFPAFVDPHVHLRTPGHEHKEDLESGTRAAAAGGFAGVIAMPNTDPTVDSAPVLRSLRDDAAATAHVPVGFLASITRRLAGEELTEMAELRDEGALGFTDDGRPVASAGLLLRALQYQRLCGGVIALHEEDPTLSASGVMHEGDASARLGLAGIPPVSESTMIARDAALAAYEDARIHVQHLSCAQSVQAVATVIGMLAQTVLDGLDTALKINPPLRTEADRTALIAALRDGTIDCVATDHAPHAREEKEVPFEEAPMGTIGLETAFAVLHTELVVPGVVGLGLLVQRMTAGAALFDLPTPRIEPGAPADVVLVDLGTEWTVGESGYHSRSEHCAFDGRTVRGEILLTLAGGAIAHRAGAPDEVAA